MCGISGIINQNNRAIEKNEIEKINTLIKHRGPDDEGYFFAKNFAFGHRRLSILDLSKDGHQPMHYLDRYTITYNGEVYNYIEIKNELLALGYEFNSHTDTEVILASYAHWGEDCVNKFNGMWAFAIYDKENETIFCSRDRFGIKPFYYTVIDNKFIFGSEIKQLLEFHHERFVNKKILIDFLVAGAIEHTNETFFENIYKLEQSHNLSYNLNNQSIEIKKYYNLSKEIENQNFTLEESISSYRETFTRAIELRLRSDVKVGSCLSGGLDSSAISAIAGDIYHKNSGKKLTAIHAKSIEKKTDESAYAKIVAQSSNLELHVVEPQNSDFLENIDELIYTMEEPYGGASVYMQYFVMKEAKKLNCKVMLDGQGGDETLLGYNRYFVLYLKEVLKKEGFKRFLEEVKEIKEKSSQSSFKILFYLVGMSLASLRIRVHKRDFSFVKHDYLSLSNYHFLYDIANASGSDKALQNLEIMKTNLPVLLKVEDKNSMRNSIETRLPFIDYKCIEKSLSIKSRFKMYQGWTKYILRKTIDPILPSNIVWRKNKFAFEAPSDVWIQEMDKNILKESKILKEISNIDTLLSKYDSLKSEYKWRLINITKWEQMFNVKISS